MGIFPIIFGLILFVVGVIAFFAGVSLMLGPKPRKRVALTYNMEE